MKVLILTNSDIGLYKFRKELLQELVHPGTYINHVKKTTTCEVIIAVADGCYVSVLEKIGCRIIKVIMDRRGMNPFNDLKLVSQYWSIINNIGPDIVLTYTIKPNIYGGILCGLKKIKYLSNVTGLGTSIENSSFSSNVILIMYKLGLRKADKVFFQNEANRNYFWKKRIIRKSSTILPGSGVNLIENGYENYPENDGNLRFLFVGRIMRNKGIDEFLSCAEYIKKNYPFTWFDIIGDYDEDQYRIRIEELHTKGIVRYYGYQNDVHSFMKNHHAIILPTYHEGLSNVLLESAAAGRPVIASDIPGCRETFDEGITGFGVKPKDRKDLIRAVERFISFSYEEKRQMGIAAREKVLREFNRIKVIKAYLHAMNI